MNRKDFLKTLIAGMAVAPAVLRAEAKNPVEHQADIEQLNEVPNAFEFDIDGYAIDRATFNFVSISCAVGSETVLEGADLWTYGLSSRHSKDILRLFYDPRPHQCIARMTRPDGKVDVLAFTGFLSAFKQSEIFQQEPTIDVRWCMTMPSTEVIVL
ncbi:hypothetical protein [Dyadobacter fermentans]|uniref:hypothetical protein n=1 Tax=Dyadobacter fermentans TaxID=94254 RepID=UPI001CBBFDFF|nr:hypothetical protein [Dyadobacter fermentans]MBZ1362151.1 hypothetical protein [Dyadobacter fermentans]